LKANLAGSDDEDYGGQIPKQAAQKKKPAKKVGSFSKPFCVCVCVLVVYLLCLQVNPTIS
jgi:hypothetical protein